MQELASNRREAAAGNGGTVPAHPVADRHPAEMAADAVALPRGLPGFPQARGFRLEELPRCQGRFLLLRLIAEEPASLIVMPTAPETAPLAAADVAAVCGALDIAPADLCLLLVVTLAREEGEEGVRAYVNLRAPIFLDTRRRLAAQMVLADSSYPLRHPLQRQAA